ncbi:MAG: DUF2007 domain-containing protein [Acidobacteriota bacterium]
MSSNLNEPLTEEGRSHDLDFVSVYSGQGVEAEMESTSIQSLLEASGIPCTVVGSQQIPSLPFEVRVPKFRLEEARRLLEDMREWVPAKVDDTPNI